jgi:hypothetical protein
MLGVGRETLLQTICWGCGEKSLDPGLPALCAECVCDEDVIERVAVEIPDRAFTPGLVAIVIGFQQRFEASIKRTPLPVRKVLERDNLTCQYCGDNPRETAGLELHIDHVKPFSHGGSNRPDNLVVACKRCNLLVSNLVFDSFWDKRQYIRQQVGLITV